MDDYTKIKVPAIVDNPISGRCSALAPLLGVSDYIIIKNGQIGYKNALEAQPKRTFQLNKIDKIQLRKRNVSSWSAEHKTDFWTRNGTEIEVSLVFPDEERYVLIPKFLMVYGEKKWINFFCELSRATGLPSEEIIETSQKKRIKKS